MQTKLKTLALVLLATAACTNTKTTQTTTTTTTTTTSSLNENTKTTTKSVMRPMRIYEEQITAVQCDPSVKGDFTYCDLKGEEITGIVKFRNGSYVYYEKGAEVDGVAVYPNKKVRTYHNRSKDDKTYTIVNYYSDGSISSIDIADKEKGRESAQYTKGSVYNAPQQQEKIDKFTYVVETDNN